MSGPALVLSRRQVARLLRIDRGETLAWLLATGKLREVPWGRGKRIPLAEVERLAREGFTTAPTASKRTSTQRPRRGVADAAALRCKPLSDILRETP